MTEPSGIHRCDTVSNGLIIQWGETDDKGTIHLQVPVTQTIVQLKFDDFDERNIVITQRTCCEWKTTSPNTRYVVIGVETWDESYNVHEDAYARAMSVVGK